MRVHFGLGKCRFGIFLFLSFFLFLSSYAQSSWPISTRDSKTEISVFKPVIESFSNNGLSFRSAIAVTLQGSNTPLFGAVWGNAQIENNVSARTSSIRNAAITDVRFPDGVTPEQQESFIYLVQQAFSANKPELLMDDILADINNAEKENQFSSQIENNPPQIIYSDEPSLLVTIDGEPIIKTTSFKDVDVVTNTPFLILVYKNKFYLSNGQLWYKASSAIGEFLPEKVKNIPTIVKSAEKVLRTDEEPVADVNDNFHPRIIVTTEPAELIQTNGKPVMSAIKGTNLLYVNNTEEQLLFDINNQNYYVLLSGRWYASKSLDGRWMFVDSRNLPADFAKIPEGSDNDLVLSSVPGTQAANEALKDAQVPKTAMIDRKKGTAEVYYDGAPSFETIEGTNIRLSINSSNTVLWEGNNYFLVDNGVWFVSSSPNGPWIVSDYRPQQVINIPPSSPAYNVKYVNIYYSTPEVVYVGYTSGYLSNYVVGRTVVYGTGHRYRPWRGKYYYPRPCTWGYGMNYNPWYGWTMNVTYGVGGCGWFGFYTPWRDPYHAAHHHVSWGYWGPTVYRPSYCVPHTHYYGRQPAVARPIRYGNYISSRPTAINRPVYNANIYNNRNRNGVYSTRNSNSTVITARPSTRDNNYNYSQNARPVSVSREIRTVGNTRIKADNKSTRQFVPIDRQSSRNEGTKPIVRPSTPGSTTRPTTRPSVPGSTNQPSVRPSAPGGTNQPSVRPSTPRNTEQPSVRPVTPGNTDQPSVRPSTPRNTEQPSVRPVTPGNTDQPSVRPSTPRNTEQPSARPSTPRVQESSSQSSRSTENARESSTPRSSSRQEVKRETQTNTSQGRSTNAGTGSVRRENSSGR